VADLLLQQTENGVEDDSQYTHADDTDEHFVVGGFAPGIHYVVSEPQPGGICLCQKQDGYGGSRREPECRKTGRERCGYEYMENGMKLGASHRFDGLNMLFVYIGNPVSDDNQQLI
jgi:hypothetical protein